MLVYVCTIDIKAAQRVKSTKSQIPATISAHPNLKPFTAVKIGKLPLQVFFFFFFFGYNTLSLQLILNHFYQLFVIVGYIFI